MTAHTATKHTFTLEQTYAPRPRLCRVPLMSAIASLRDDVSPVIRAGDAHLGCGPRTISTSRRYADGTIATIIVSNTTEHCGFIVGPVPDD